MTERLGLRLELDYKQTRVWQDGLTALAEGSYPTDRASVPRVSGWDLALSYNVFQDPVTWSVFPLPNVFDPAWLTTATGSYARYGLADFTFANASKWKADDTALTGDNWLVADGLTADETMILNSALPENTGVYVGGFSYNSAENRVVDYEGGWNSSPTLGSGVGFRKYSDGQFEIWKDGRQVGSYKIGGTEGQDARYQEFGGVAFIPCRKRELLVLSKGLAGFVHVFDDLDETDDEPTIAPGEKFWLKFPAAATGSRSVKVQVARIKTKTSGYVVSKKIAFQDAPLADQKGPYFGPGTTPEAYADLYGATTTISLLDEDGTAAFVPDGSAKTCRIKVEIAADGLKMPGVYGCLATFAGILEDTTPDVFDLRDYAYECSFTVPESGPAEATVRLSRLAEMENAWNSGPLGEMGIKTQANRPLLMVFKGDGDDSEASPYLIEGRTDGPKLDLGFDDDLSEVTLTVHDKWTALERYVFRDKVPLTGFSLASAVRYVVSGVQGTAPERYYIDPAAEDFIIPAGTSPSANDFGFTVMPGDRGSDVIERLVQCFAGDWYYGFVPVVGGTVFCFLGPDTLPVDPEVTVYLTAEEAKESFLAEGYDEEWARQVASLRTVTRFEQDVVPPYATECRVTGWDPRKGEPIQAVMRATDLEDPTTPPRERPDGWLGERVIYGYRDGAIQSVPVLEDATRSIFNKVCVPRRLAEWDCGLLSKPDGSLVWRGDVVKIDGIGDYRVTSIQAGFPREPNEEDDWSGGYGKWCYRPATYTGELIDGDSDGWRAGTSVAGIRLIRKSMDRRRASRDETAKSWDILRVFGSVVWRGPLAP